MYIRTYWLSSRFPVWPKMKFCNSFLFPPVFRLYAPVDDYSSLPNYSKILPHPGWSWRLNI